LVQAYPPSLTTLSLATPGHDPHAHTAPGPVVPKGSDGEEPA